MPAGIALELCVDSLVTALQAQDEGADRIELCGPGDGGRTPAPVLLDAVMADLRVPVHVMIRPREGDFDYDANEFSAMEQAVDAAREARAAAVVFGILTREGTFDLPRMRALTERARPLLVGCHRAMDATRGADAALDALIGIGTDIVLTSGHARTALEGADVLARHVRRAGDALCIMAGGSVRADHVADLVARTGVRAVHARGLEAGTGAALRARLTRPQR